MAHFELPRKKYKIIYADPPWKYGGGKNHNFEGLAVDHYPVMTKKEICEMPVRQITSDDGAALFLWVTPPQLETGFDVMRAWGFRYRTIGFTWVKLNNDGSPFFGLGFWTHSNAEHCLIGTSGKNYPRRIDKTISSVVMTKRMKHSKKPPEVRDKIVRLVGDLPRIELFAREQTDGWDCWGDEVAEQETAEGWE